VVHKYVIMGVQGSGKGTQARRLAADLELEHIEVGDIFRWNVQHHTKLGAQVRREIDAGHLVGDDVVEQVVRERLEMHDWNYGFIIDGFPRTVGQAAFFLERYDIDAVVHLLMPDSEVEQRVMARRVCADCGLDHNLMSHRPEQEGRCDVCGGELVTRDDDTPEALAQRLRDYHERTEPAIALFAAKERLVEVDATQSKDEVYRQIRHQLHLEPS
jgi:adenylate kinase